ncbi:MAG TPA: hypothetical protein VGE79_15435 [Niastella sp.]
MYTINKEKKRLEPTSTKCEYCEVEHSSNMEDNYFIPLFKENDRTNIIVYRSVKYSKIPVGIPRCRTCLEIHQQCANKGALQAWGIGAAIFAFFFLIGGGAIAIGLVLCILIGLFGTGYLTTRITVSRGIFTKKQGAERNQTVQELILDGWTFTQPTA